MKIVVLDGYCLNPGDLNWGGLRALGDLTVHDRTPAAETAARLAGAEAAFTNKTALPAGLLREAKSLRYVGVLATGYNIVDVAAARECGITVTNIPTYGTASVAQHAFALLLELTNTLACTSRPARRWRRTPVPGAAPSFPAASSAAAASGGRGANRARSA
jgi:glycerate dehydrogenase